MLRKIGRKKSTVRSAHQCFCLIYFLLYQMGCLGCKIRNGKKIYRNKRYRFYRYIYRITYLAVLFAVFVYKMNDAVLKEIMMNNLTPVMQVILTFECVVCPSIYVATVYYLDVHCEIYVRLANTLQDLDDELHKHFPGIQWNYYKSKRKYNCTTMILFVFYTIMSTIYVFYTTNCTCGWISTLMISISYICISGAPGFAGFLFIGNMDLLRLRFRLIRKLLRQHLLHLDNMEAISKFQLLVNFFKQYSSLITLINQVFSVVTSYGLFHDFVIIACLGYLLCFQALDPNGKTYEYVFTILFMAPWTYKVIAIGIYGYATQYARRNCESYIIKMGYLLKRSSSTQLQVETFLHWRMHNNYCITVGKNKICNLSLIFAILNSVANYILILIQLQFQQNNIVNNFLTDIELINKNN